MGPVKFHHKMKSCCCRGPNDPSTLVWVALFGGNGMACSSGLALHGVVWPGGVVGVARDMRGLPFSERVRAINRDMLRVACCIASGNNMFHGRETI